MEDLMYMHTIGALWVLCQPSSCLGTSGLQLALHRQFPHQHGKSGVPSKCWICSACADCLLCVCVYLFGMLSTLTLHLHSGIIRGGQVAARGGCHCREDNLFDTPPPTLVWVTSVKGVSMHQVYCNVGHLWQCWNFPLTARGCKLFGLLGRGGASLKFPKISTLN